MTHQSRGTKSQQVTASRVGAIRIQKGDGLGQRVACRRAWGMPDKRPHGAVKHASRCPPSPKGMCIHARKSGSQRRIELSQCGTPTQRQALAQCSSWSAVLPIVPQRSLLSVVLLMVLHGTTLSTHAVSLHGSTSSTHAMQSMQLDAAAGMQGS